MNLNTHIALLRGINVGGRNKLPMKELASLFVQAGCRDVQTYIQSGNIIFNAESQVVREIPKVIAEAIHLDYGYNVPVVTRTVEELVTIVESNPFLGAGAEERELHVAFLSELPGLEKLSSLDPDRSPPDEIAPRGTEIYLRLPNGVARTKFTNAYFDSALSTTSTLRNWRTTLKLLELYSG